MTDIIFGIVIALLYGIAKSCTDIRHDEFQTNRIWHWFQDYPRLLKWYVGGGDNGYNQRFPWTSDFWHTFDGAKLYLLGLAVLYPFTLTWELLYWTIPALWVAGRTFALFYHYFLPDMPIGGIKKFIVNSILFWKAENVNAS